ncbi:DUF445 domain-containing protein [Pseudomonas sp. NPDC090203]|uniref:DUF445 domain-containing protein n=1 Tax=Pseudomonas sp. NPDC090203 TaxID=3364477 RepID=UPI0038139CB1
MFKPQTPLARMKAVASGLLLIAACLYITALELTQIYPTFAGYLKAFSEAAMVGAIADWFAVTALFRRPLGLPIPHTAIIPRNKARIGANLGDFICTHFLSREQVLAKVSEFDAARRVSQWLSVPANATQLSGLAVSLAGHGVGALRDERVRQFVRGTALARLEQVDLARMSGQLLEVLTDDGRAQEVLEGVLDKVDAMMQSEATQQRIAQMIAAELDVLRFSVFGKEFSFSGMAGNWSSDKLVRKISTVISEVNADPEHELRKAFDEQLHTLIEKLKEDPAFRLRASQLRAQLVQHPALHGYLTGLVDDLVNWLETDIRSDDSTLRLHLNSGVLKLGEALREAPAMRSWINEQLLIAAGPMVERYRAQIGNYIAERIDAWNEHELVEQLEAQVGKDLQFIRINGTLVGGLAGLMIHGGTQLLAGV